MDTCGRGVRDSGTGAGDRASCARHDAMTCMDATARPPKTKAPATRLYALIARQARIAVIFRRGPSRQVQLIRWNLDEDSFEHGQWFKGRIYERRCDLSPSGRLLVYFAATQHGLHDTWTAISRPPYLTALALWPNRMGCWGGGGVFEDEQRLLLNHQPMPGKTPFAMASGFELGADMQVAPFGAGSGCGEDAPISAVLRARDGWQVIDEGGWRQGGPGDRARHLIEPPAVQEKAGRAGLRLHALLRAIGPQDGPYYDLDHRVLDGDGRVLVDLPRSDWADWDGGDLLFARAGCIYRMPHEAIAARSPSPLQHARLLHDFSDARFSELMPSPQAHVD